MKLCFCVNDLLRRQLILRLVVIATLGRQRPRITDSVAIDKEYWYQTIDNGTIQWVNCIVKTVAWFKKKRKEKKSQELTDKI